MTVTVLQDVNIGKGLELNPVTKQMQVTIATGLAFDDNNKLKVTPSFKYIKAGDSNAPQLKYKKITGNLPSSLSFGTNNYEFAHGLDASKILNIDAVIKHKAKDEYYKPDTDIDYSLYKVFWDASNIKIRLSSFSASNLAGQSVMFLVTYH